MREQHPGGDGLIRIVGIAEGKPQVIADIPVQIQRSLLHQPHGANGGKGLGDGGGAVAAVKLEGEVVGWVGRVDIAVTAGTLVDQFPSR